MKISVRKASDQKVIAKKPLTNLYEMNSRKKVFIWLKYGHVWQKVV